MLWLLTAYILSTGPIAYLAFRGSIPFEVFAIAHKPTTTFAEPSGLNSYIRWWVFRARPELAPRENEYEPDPAVNRKYWTPTGTAESNKGT